MRDVPYSALQFAFYGKLHINVIFILYDFASKTLFFRSEQFKKLAKHTLVQPGDQLPIAADMLTGSLAGAIAGAITTPLDVIKTLLQTQIKRKRPSGNSATELHVSASVPSSSISTTPQPQAPLQPKHYSSIVEGLVWNYKHQGIGGLFRGIGPRVFWTSLQSAVMFVIYEQVLHLEERLREHGEWPPAAAFSNLSSRHDSH